MIFCRVNLNLVGRFLAIFLLLFLFYFQIAEKILEKTYYLILDLFFITERQSRQIQICIYVYIYSGLDISSEKCSFL